MGTLFTERWNRHFETPRAAHRVSIWWKFVVTEDKRTTQRIRHQYSSEGIVNHGQNSLPFRYEESVFHSHDLEVGLLVCTAQVQFVKFVCLLSTQGVLNQSLLLQEWNEVRIVCHLCCHPLNCGKRCWLLCVWVCASYSPWAETSWFCLPLLWTAPFGSPATISSLH